jgi:hypothetical protein
VNGCLFTATNGNSLFLPAAGNHSSASSHHYNHYWSSSLYTDPYNARDFSFYSGYVMGSGFRSSGYSVRPVREN